MTRIKLFGLALVALLALSATLSASAFALPELLPSTAGERFTDRNDGTERLTLEEQSGKQVICNTASSEGTQTTDTLGTFHIVFEGCRGEGQNCETTGAGAGKIISEGTFHYVYDALGSGESLGVAVLFLPKETAFKCTIFVTVEVKGTLVCLILRPLESAKSHLFHCNRGTARGEQAQRQYYDDGGTIVRTQLLSNFNRAGFKESNELALAEVNYREANSFMNE